MHDAAYQWVAAQVDRFGPFDSVAEFGGRNINGTVRDLFDGGYTAVDIVDGPGVDVVADCADWRPSQPVECVVSTEVLEHTPAWRELVCNAAACLVDGGVLIVTCAGPGREPHGTDGGPVRDEFYENVIPGDLRAALAPFSVFSLDVLGTDLRCWAVK